MKEWKRKSVNFCECSADPKAKSRVKEKCEITVLGGLHGKKDKTKAAHINRQALVAFS